MTYKDTREGKDEDDAKVIFFCNYRPPGNYKNRVFYEIGEPCSMCEDSAANSVVDGGDGEDGEAVDGEITLACKDVNISNGLCGLPVPVPD